MNNTILLSFLKVKYVFLNPPVSSQSTLLQRLAAFSILVKHLTFWPVDGKNRISGDEAAVCGGGVEGVIRVAILGIGVLLNVVTYMTSSKPDFITSVPETAT